MILLPIEKYNHLMKPVKKESIQPIAIEENQGEKNITQKKVKKIITAMNPPQKKVVLKKPMIHKVRELSPPQKKGVLKKAVIHKVRELSPPQKKVVLKKAVKHKIQGVRRSEKNMSKHNVQNDATWMKL